jgi:hypothetical protein
LSVQASHPPQPILILGAQCANSRAMGRWEDFKMCYFVHFFDDAAIDIHFLDEDQFLGTWYEIPYLWSNSSSQYSC